MHRSMGAREHGSSVREDVCTSKVNAISKTSIARVYKYPAEDADAAVAGS